MIDRRGAPLTEGLGTATLIPQGYGGDAHDQVLELRMLTSLVTGAEVRTSLTPVVSLRTEALVEVSAPALLMQEGVHPWRSF